MQFQKKRVRNYTKKKRSRGLENFFNAFSEEINHSTVNFTYANADMLKSQSMPYSGKLPTAEDEIVVQESFLDSLGYSTELGYRKIPFSEMNHDFRLTGILNWTIYSYYIERISETTVWK